MWMANAHHTFIIIGGGPIGLACAIEAKKAGIDYLVIEKGTLVNSLYNYPVNMTFFSTSERLEIGDVPFVSNNSKPTRAESLEYYRRVMIAQNLKVNLFERVLEVKHTPGGDPKRAQHNFEIKTSKGDYTAGYVVIATGFYDIPYLLNVPGEDLPKVTHYYKDPHFYAFQNVLVVGASNSAVDAALETWRKGANVSMVVRGEEIGARVKYWVRPDMVNRISEGSVTVYYQSSIREIRENEVDINTQDGVVTIANDWVIAMTGYQPDLEFLEKAGVKIANDEVKKPFYSEETYETNVKNLFLAGVICGGLNTNRLFIENSREHAKRIAATILQRIS